jgi:microsomal dipeptidase-like Zn-dependent dipeptidase
VLELTRDPVVYSHGRPRTYFPRRPEDSRWHGRYDVSRGPERLRALAENGGVLGVIFYRQENLAEVVADLEYALEHAGPEHVGLGSDLFGLDSAPLGLETVACLPALTEALAARGHSDEVILGILGRNFLRVFERVWRPA